ADPVGLAKIVLRADKGWDPARVIEAANTGPLNNEIALEHKVMVHMTYFTALVDEEGRLHTFPDVYGHEQRISLALAGKWDRIVKAAITWRRLSSIFPMRRGGAPRRMKPMICPDGASAARARAEASSTAFSTATTKREWLIRCEPLESPVNVRRHKPEGRD